jgi:translation initiation factor IF-2
LETYLPKEKLLHLEGSAKVLKVFRLNDKKGTVVAGVSVVHGRLKNNNDSYVFRVTRRAHSNQDPLVMVDNYSGPTELKRFKDIAHEVIAGYLATLGQGYKLLPLTGGGGQRVWIVVTRIQ